jgi:hypothetical protein
MTSHGEISLQDKQLGGTGGRWEVGGRAGSLLSDITSQAFSIHAIAIVTRGEGADSRKQSVLPNRANMSI